MKVFIAESREKGYIESNDGKIMNYHWCENGELLMFSHFQLNNGNPSAIGMCGTNSHKFTTYIVVKDLKISKEFYKELLIDSIEKSMNCVIDENGNFGITVGFELNFNINTLMNELLDKASKFEDNQQVRCIGRELFPMGTKVYKVFGKFNKKNSKEILFAIFQDKKRIDNEF